VSESVTSPRRRRGLHFLLGGALVGVVACSGGKSDEPPAPARASIDAVRSWSSCFENEDATTQIGGVEIRNGDALVTLKTGEQFRVANGSKTAEPYNDAAKTLATKCGR
jgi:hypothetical protein